MNRWRLMTQAALIAVILGVSACSSRTSVEATVKSPDYHRQPKTLFVIANMGPGLSNRDGDHSDKFAHLLVGSLDQCGTQTRVFVQNRIEPLTLTDNTAVTIKRTIDEFKPEAIMTLTWQLNRSSNRGYNATSYLATLTDASGVRSPVWKAKLSILTYYQPAEVFAETLISQMKTDGIISRTCAPPVYDRLL